MTDEWTGKTDGGQAQTWIDGDAWMTGVHPDFVACPSRVETGICWVVALLEAACPVGWGVVDSIAPSHGAQAIALAICR